MTPVPIFNGRISDDGRLLLLDEERPLRERYLQTLAGEVVDVTVKPHKDQRSQKANAYLWGHVYEEMSTHTGHSPEDIHDAMCERFLPNERKRVEFFNRLTGESLTVETDSRRSSKLTGGPFYDFVENVRQFAREFLSVETQDPDPDYWRHRKAA